MHDVFAAVARLIVAASNAMRPHLAYVALAVSATLLAIFGSDISGGVKEWVKNWHFPVRLAVFVFLVTFGYGAMSLAFARFLAGLLGRIDDLYLAPAILITFVLIGALAEHKKNI
jgi:hypothetical protein